MEIRDSNADARWVARIESWRPWFAWRPTRLIDNRTVWLERIEYRISGGQANFDFDGLIRIWEYRAGIRESGSPTP